MFEPILYNANMKLFIVVRVLRFECKEKGKNQFTTDEDRKDDLVENKDKDEGGRH